MCTPRRLNSSIAWKLRERMPERIEKIDIKLDARLNSREGVGRIEPGDVVHVYIEGIGTLSNPVIAPA